MPRDCIDPVFTAAERAREARQILAALREELSEDLERKLTGKARRFLEAKWLEMDLGGRLENITVDQYWWLQDLKSKFD